MVMSANTEIYIEKLQVTFNSLAHKIETDAREIGDLQLRLAGAVSALVATQHELEVVTQERDNALLRIEELERTHTDKWDRFDEHRGGVNPNA